MEQLRDLMTDKIGGIMIAVVALILFLGLLRIFGEKALRWLSWQIKKKKYLNSPIWKADHMSGEEFEMFLKAHLERSGYRAKLTPKTRDYGADLLMTTAQGHTLILQAKRNQKDIGIAAIQEALGAVSYYHADKGIVATNRYFTKSARELAARSGIELWNRHDIERIMKQETPIGQSTEPETATPTVTEPESCPLCKGRLIERSGKYGIFYGCSNYPACKYTRRIS